MKAKFSVGNRINHYKFGEGMIIQIRNNQMEVLFLDEQRRSFSADTDDVVLIGLPVMEVERSEPPLPSAANKIKKELDQLKVGNRAEYFDYELNNQNKSIPMNKNTRVFHSLLGEGMITKILKNEYQIIFLNGEKQNIPINSPDLKLLTNSETIVDSEKTVMSVKEENPIQDDLFVGKQIFIPNVGDGMVSKIFEETYEVIFLDGHKQSFILPDNNQDIEISIKPEIPKKQQKTDHVIIKKDEPHFDEADLFVGKQINHPELGDGMVSKLGESFYEIIFLNGKKHRFEFAEKKHKGIDQKETTLEFEPIEIVKNTMPIVESSFQTNDLYVGKQINHPDFGEGMVSKILKNSYEIIFLDGKKQSFSFLNSVEKQVDIKPTEKLNNKSENNDLINSVFDKSAFELPIEKFQNTSNVKYPESKPTQIDDFFEKPVKVVSEKSKNKAESTVLFNTEIEKHLSSEVMIGTAVSHPKHGNGIVCNIDEYEIEVVFYNHKKIVYSAKSNELNYLNVKTKA